MARAESIILEKGFKISNSAKDLAEEIIKKLC
jgi:hypothetical protein